MVHPVRIVLMGPPGCGKGTQAKKIEAKYHIPQLSTGDVLRDAVSRGSDVGKQAKAFMDAGMLVPDEVIIGVMREQLQDPACKEGYILDGFPRTIGQAEALEGILQEKKEHLLVVINLDVAEEELVKRLSGRRQCRSCGAGYHLSFQKPKIDGRCDLCGGELYQRDDDNEMTVRARLRVYREQTAPLLGYYQEHGYLQAIDGSGPVDEIFGNICSLIDERIPSGQI